MGSLTQEGTKPSAYIIPADLLEGVTEYLMGRPWREVANAVPRLLELKPCETDSKIERIA